MNPSSGESISTPQFEAPQPSDGPEQQHDKQMEQTGQSESGAGKQQPKAASAPVAPVMPLPSDIPVAGAVSIPSDVTKADDDASDNNPQELAHDSHRIEKQWVDRAKKVIAQTKDDPHSQKTEMSQVKADYIRRRFNKTIPTDGSAKL